MPAKKISDNVYLISNMPGGSMNDSCCYVIRGEPSVMIDCGCGEAHEHLSHSLERIGIGLHDINCVIGTHAHYDHVAGIERMREDSPEIQFALHRDDAVLIEQADQEATCADWVFGASVTPQKVDIQFQGDESLTIGNLVFDIIHTPGHSPGSICVRVNIDGKTFLFSGDCLVPGSHRVKSDISAWRGTLAKLEEIDFDIMLAGHPWQWVFNPYFSSLMQPFSKRLGKRIFRLCADTMTEPFWQIGTFQYTHIMPVMTRFGNSLNKRRFD